MQQGYLVEQPDGSPAVIAVTTSEVTTQSQPKSNAKANPFEACDQIAANELGRMQKEDADSLVVLAGMPKEVTKVHNEADQATIAHETYGTYTAKNKQDDAAVASAIEATDVIVHQAINAAAAGGPSALNQGHGTPANDWLQRLHAQDAAIKRAVEETDRSILKS